MHSELEQYSWETNELQRNFENDFSILQALQNFMQSKSVVLGDETVYDPAYPYFVEFLSQNSMENYSTPYTGVSVRDDEVDSMHMDDWMVEHIGQSRYWTQDEWATGELR